MCECMSTLVVEGFAFLVIPSVHREGVGVVGGGGVSSGVRVGLEGCFSNDG